MSIHPQGNGCRMQLLQRKCIRPRPQSKLRFQKLLPMNSLERLRLHTKRAVDSSQRDLCGTTILCRMHLAVFFWRGQAVSGKKASHNGRCNMRCSPVLLRVLSSFEKNISPLTLSLPMKCARPEIELTWELSSNVSIHTFCGPVFGR